MSKEQAKKLLNEVINRNLEGKSENEQLRSQLYRVRLLKLLSTAKLPNYIHGKA